MDNIILESKGLNPYTINAPLQERAKIAAEIIHSYRVRKYFPPTETILNPLGLSDEDVEPVYKELYGRPLHLNRVPRLQEHERKLYFPSSETGVTDAQLYHLRSKGVVDLRIEDGILFVHRNNWDGYRNRRNGYLSIKGTAKFLGVSPPYVRKLLERGDLNSKPPGTHEYGNTHLISISEAEDVKSKLEWLNLSKHARRGNITREGSRQILERHTLSAHKDKRKGKRIKTHWKRIRAGNQVLVRVIDFDSHFNKLN